MEASPVELVKIASELECAEIGLFVYMPPNPMPGHKIPDLEIELVTNAHKRDMLDHMRDLNVKVGNIEFISINPTFDMEEHRGTLELGGALGARGVTVLVQDGEERRVLDNLAILCDAAAEYNLVASVEFIGMTPHCNSMGRAVQLIDQVNRPNLGLVMDTLNVVRTGATLAEIEALPARYFRYAQISDGYGTHTSTGYIKEALDRLMPGEGDWPLKEILTVLPAATPLDVEVPSRVARIAGMSARDRARWAVTATRKLLEDVTPIR
jgi:sugar phosphate isomerase/epimerase